MFLVLSKEAFFEYSQQTKQPSQQRHLEDNTHHEDEHREVVDVTLQIDLVCNTWAQIVLDKETESKGKDECVTYCAT